MRSKVILNLNVGLHEFLGQLEIRKCWSSWARSPLSVTMYGSWTVAKERIATWIILWTWRWPLSSAMKLLMWPNVCRSNAWCVKSAPRRWLVPVCRTRWLPAPHQLRSLPSVSPTPPYNSLPTTSGSLLVTLTLSLQLRYTPPAEIFYYCRWRRMSYRLEKAFSFIMFISFFQCMFVPDIRTPVKIIERDSGEIDYNSCILL